MVDQTLADLHPIPGGCQVDFVPTPMDDHRTQNALSYLRNHLFRHFHDRVVISVSHIELKLRKFGVVLERHAFIAEIPPNFVDAVQSANKQTLQVKLKTHPQKEFLVKLVVVGGEGFGCRSSVNGLQDGRFNFLKAAFIQKFAQGFERLCAHTEDFADFGVDCQVHITLAIAGFRVGQRRVANNLSIHHLVFGSWQLIERFGEHPEILNLQGDFSTFCAHQGACGFNEVAKVIESHKLVQLFLSEFVDAHKELDFATAIFDVGKRKLAHVADGAQATRQRQLQLFGVASSFACFKRLEGVSIAAVLIRPGWIRLNPVLAQLLHFCQAKVLEFRKVIG